MPQWMNTSINGSHYRAIAGNMYTIITQYENNTKAV